ncbi:family 8 carbohydrate esterase [Xylaria arbuscula]|nr:family 8 carbohydrate esterase [Xylaria arbuscula]
MKVSALLLSCCGSASLVLASSRTSAPSGCVTVATSGGDYTSVQDAIDDLSTTSTDAQCVFIDQGTYTEQVYIASRAAQLTIYGYTTDTTSYAENGATITYNLDATSAGSDDASGTLRVWAANVKIYNVNVVNSYGKGSQAIALSAYANSGYYGCQLYGFQDTVLANKGLQYYSNCEITGATDFIFGQQAQAWFEGVDIRVRAGGYYITANGRDSTSNPSYYLFNNCNVAAASGESVSSGEFYLGRPWRTYARVVFQNTELSDVINSAGWTIWDDTTVTSDVYYAEYGNSGDGASGDRVSWETTLSSAVTEATVLGSDYASGAWYDASYPN